MEIKDGVNKKVKTIATITIIIGILIILTPICAFGYVKYTLYTLKKDTYNYLKNEQGYTDEVILNIDAAIQKGSFFTALVEFSDEPEIVYRYKRDDGQIIQIGPDPSGLVSYKHRE